MKKIGLFVMAFLVLTASVSIAGHVPVPAVSDGGELAYVRDFPPDAVATAHSGGRVTATYVAWSTDMRPQHDLILAYTSRGRVADTQVWHHIRLPSGIVASLDAVPVAQYERGLLVGASDRGCVALLNGVNAGMGFVARDTTEVRFKTTGHFDVVPAGAGRVELWRDGHVLALETAGNATLDVSGVNVAVVAMGPGGEVRSWIDGGAFPATTALMHATFDDVFGACVP